MPSPLPSPLKTLATVAMVLVLAGCQAGPTPRPVPSVAQIGSNLKCASGDHGFEDTQAGWGFCYPGTWKYQERSQGSTSPPGLDLTFDVTDIPCTPPTRPPPRPPSPPTAALFPLLLPP